MSWHCAFYVNLFFSSLSFEVKFFIEFKEKRKEHV